MLQRNISNFCAKQLIYNTNTMRKLFTLIALFMSVASFACNNLMADWG